MQNFQRMFVCMTGCVLAFALAGCGGGGGGGGAMSLANTVAGNTASHAQAANGQVRIATRATPISGSVTQSSTVNGSNVTLDQVTADASYNSDGTLTVSVRNGRPGSWGTVDSGDIALRGNNLVGTATETEYRERAVAKTTDDGGVVVVDVFTDRLSSADTDYLVGGVWVYVPPTVTSTSDLEFGAFADGPDANLTPANYLRTASTATYEGDATGLFAGQDNGGVLLGEFVADAQLAATFGTAPVISGSISNFMEIDSARESLTVIPGSPTLTLGSSTITNAAGGFFNGDTSGTQTVQSVAREYEGKWGGQFYGTTAQAVGGTFGGSTSGNSDNYEISFVGAFGAEKQ